MQNIVFLAVAFHSFTSWLQFEQYLTTGLVVYKAFWNNLWSHLNLLGDECLKHGFPLAHFGSDVGKS